MSQWWGGRERNAPTATSTVVPTQAPTPVRERAGGAHCRMDCTSTGIPGTRLRARRGRNARTERMTE